ncbi:MAG TPA: hypothetical protein VFQ12_06580, partial [Thermoleophilaceae bacterium]|nr:hypothetical protein [Thermoleophilaceae bacterium]
MLGLLAVPVRLPVAVVSLLTVVAATLTALTIPAAAQSQTVQVRLASGEIVTVEVPPGQSLESMGVEGTQVPTAGAQAQGTTEAATTEAAAAEPAAPKTAAPTETETETAAAEQPEQAPNATGGAPQEKTGSGERVRRERREVPKLKARVRKDEHDPGRSHERRTKLRRADGSPARSNPGFVDVLPGPSSAVGVPNFIIRKFRVPPFLLPIY